MSEQELALANRIEAVDVYGDKEEVGALGARLRKTVPGWGELTDLHAVSAAQYALLSGANPFRGEVHAFTDKKGNFHIVEGYKLLVRWAKRECDYSERYTTLTEEEMVEYRLSPKDIAIKCQILRNDQLPVLDTLAKVMSGIEAYEIAATHAVGVVQHTETVYRDGNPKSPPTGWTWHQRAEIRALKNALNRAYGMPSPQEIAKESWDVEGVVTVPEDWRVVEPGMNREVAERTAAVESVARTSKATVEEMSAEERQEMLDANRVLLHGEDEDPLSPEALAETPESKPWDNTEPFTSPSQAQSWGFNQGCFKHPKHVENAYNRVKEENEPPSAKAMAYYWREYVHAKIGDPPIEGEVVEDEIQIEGEPQQETVPF